MKSARYGMCLIFLVLALVGAQAALAGPSMGSEIVVSDQDFDEHLPSVAYNTQRHEYFAVWHVFSPLQGRWVEGARYDASGTLLGSYTIAFEDSPPRDNFQPAIEYDPVNDRYLVVWVHDVYGDTSDYDLVGRLIPWNGPDPSFQGFNVCTFTSKQWNPKIAFAGTQQEFIVVWWNEAMGGVASYISSQRVALNGTLSGSAIHVASGTEERVAPDVAYNQSRNEYLIVYQLMDGGGGNIMAVRMNAGGTILGLGEVGIAEWPDPETAPSVAASAAADEWAIAWQSEPGGSLTDIYARRAYVGSGLELTTPVLVDSTPVNEMAADISARASESEYTIVWQKQYSSSSGPFGIASRKLDTMNVLGDTAWLREIPIGDASDCSQPAVVVGRDGTFVTWEHDRNSATVYQDIHARIMFKPLFEADFETNDFSQWSSVQP